MELVSNNIPKTKNVVDQEDANSSTFRERRKMVIFIFTFFFIFLAIIIGSLFFYLLRDTTSDHTDQNDSITLNPSIQTFYIYSDCYVTESSLDAFDRIVKNKSITNPNQIFTLALQTAAKQLEYITTTSLISHAKNTDEFASTNCSNSLSHALGQIRGGLEIMRVNPFVEKLSDDQWNEMMDRIIAASVNMRYCLGDMEKLVESTAVIEEVREKVHEVQLYVSSNEQFLRNYKGEADVLQNSRWSEKDNVNWGRVIPENLFIICVSGLFLLFIFFLFWTLCTTR